MQLTATAVSKSFSRRAGSVRAVDQVTLSVGPGDFTAVVGESGSGKSTMARILLGLLDPDEGAVTMDGTPITTMNRGQLMQFRRSVQCVLQDPSAALNPRKSVQQILGEVIRLHGVARGRAAVDAKVREALEQVDLRPSQTYASRLPHELSGGQRQRVLIARALVLSPRIIIADEAVSALDVSVKAGILNLLNRLREDLNIGYIFITHDLPVVKKVAEYVYVMRDGKIVEHAPKSRLFASPQTDYTSELLAASPEADPRIARGWIRSAAQDA